MIINKLVLTNFGVFHGRHEFELKPRTRHGAQRPIVLIGGKNGSGKTTILEALRLCLYGRSALSKRASTKEYSDYLSNLIHRAPQMLIDPDHAQIELEFDYATNGIRETFNIQRSWQKTSSGVNETLVVSRNDIPISELESDYWQEFIKDLIPQGIVQLFFFDGELIQQLAYGDKDDAKLAESLMKLLGLDLIEQLHADLAVYQQRYKKSKQNSEFKKEIELLELKKLDLEQSISQVKQDLAQKSTQIERLSLVISNLEEKVCLQGGQWVDDRNKLMIQKENLITEVDTLQNQIREQCSGLLPFSIVPELCQSLKVQLESEEQFQKTNSFKREIMILIEKARLESTKLLNKFSHIPKSELKKVIDTFVETLTPSMQPTEVNVIHGLSSSEQSQVLSWINEAVISAPKRIEELSIQLEKTTRELQSTEAKLQRIPPEESIRPIIGEISVNNKILGTLQHEVTIMEKERNSFTHQLDDIKRTIERLYESIDKNENMEERLLLSSKVQMVLRDFVADVKARKVSDLENCFSYAFNKLVRKGDLVNNIKIDPETFSMSLFNRNGREIFRKDLSNGEKQIYAISMLWALGQVSGRPLPVVIDTPLGRLDSDHRTHIVENYFPKASHQVVLLSTDTEIERSYFKFLGPYISHAYQLEYDSSEGTTKLQEGYFWSGKETVVAT